jgi:hypothetical protein
MAKKVTVKADYDKESKQLITHAIGMAKFFGGKVLIFEGKGGEEFPPRQTQKKFCFRICEADGVNIGLLKKQEAGMTTECSKPR